MTSRRANIKHITLSLGVAAVFVLVGIWLHTPLFSAARAVVLPAGEMLWSSQEGMFSWFAVRWQAREDRIDLSREIIALRQERDQLKAHVAAYESIREENQQLKEVLGWSTAEESQLANVLTTPPLLSPYDTIVIDRGEQHGVLPEQFAFVGDVVLGTISEAALSNAVVSLFSTPGRKTAARVGEDNVPLTLSGRGGGSFVAVLPKEVAILPGDLITISDTQPGLIAEVVSIERTEQNPEQLIRARVPVNIFTLTQVLVGQ